MRSESGPSNSVSIDAGIDGFHMRVDGEEFVFTTSEADAFAAAVGISEFGARTKKPVKSAKAVTAIKASGLVQEPSPAPASARGSPAPKTSSRRLDSAKPSGTRPTRPTVSRGPGRPDGAPKPSAARSLASSPWHSRQVDLSSLQGMIGSPSAIAGRGPRNRCPAAAGRNLALRRDGRSALTGAATVDPLLATRLPEAWPASRLVLVALAVIVPGLLLVAF